MRRLRRRGCFSAVCPILGTHGLHPLPRLPPLFPCGRVQFLFLHPPFLLPFPLLHDFPVFFSPAILRGILGRPDAVVGVCSRREGPDDIYLPPVHPPSLVGFIGLVDRLSDRPRRLGCAVDERYAGQDFTGHGLIGPGFGGGRVRRGVFVFWDSLTAFDRIPRKAESGEAGTDRVGLMFCEERAHEGKAHAGWQLLTSTIGTAGRALVLPMPMLHSILTHMPRGTNVPAALESVSLGRPSFPGPTHTTHRSLGHDKELESEPRTRCTH